MVGLDDGALEDGRALNRAAEPGNRARRIRRPHRRARRHEIEDGRRACLSRALVEGAPDLAASEDRQDDEQQDTSEQEGRRARYARSRR